MKADFSGYATKNGLECSDGRTIMRDAFKHNDGVKVPLVWMHQHDGAENVLGHAILENREDGVYAYGFFNSTPAGEHAKAMVEHGDVEALSIYATKLTQSGANVIHGDIKEVSLVLSGANPGALIENFAIQHGDTVTVAQDKAVIYGASTLSHADEDLDVPDDNDGDDPLGGKTIAQVVEGMDEAERAALEYIVGDVLQKAAPAGSADEGGSGDTAQHSEFPPGPLDPNDKLSHSRKDSSMTRNVFTQGADGKLVQQRHLTHSEIGQVLASAKELGSLKGGVLAHAGTFGIDNIDILFPDAQTLQDSPQFISRRMEWVAGVLDKVKKSPFARIKTVQADITEDEARAKGYITGNKKTEEVFKLLKRVTVPQTIYKKQKLDRDDIIDITTLDVVAWIKAEMRVMLDEEIARAILIGDGRSVSSPDKINTDNIRPVATDDELYTHKVTVASNITGEDLVDEVLRSRKYYKGSGQPTFYTTIDVHTDLILAKDGFGHRLWKTDQELSAALGVAGIVDVEPLETIEGLIGLMVNLTDYTVGADRGGQVTMFEDFDIDFNQEKYLLETRISGALQRVKSAVAFWRSAGTEVAPTAPSFDAATNTISLPSTAGVDYQVNGTTRTGDVVITENSTVIAKATTGYYLKSGVTKQWNYTFSAA